jgi:hypothetical protein
MAVTITWSPLKSDMTHGMERFPHIERRERQHQEKSREAKADIGGQRAGYAPCFKSYIGRRLHCRRARNGLAQCHAVPEGLIAEPLLAFDGHFPYIGDHRGAAEGGKSQFQEGEEKSCS